MRWSISRASPRANRSAAPPNSNAAPATLSPRFISAATWSSCPSRLLPATETDSRRDSAPPVRRVAGNTRRLGGNHSRPLCVFSLPLPSSPVPRHSAEPFLLNFYSSPSVRAIRPGTDTILLYTSPITDGSLFYVSDTASAAEACGKLLRNFRDDRNAVTCAGSTRPLY